MYLTIFFFIFAVSIAVLIYWKIFTKAGKPGWMCLIPFFNLYILMKIVGRPGWWMLLFFVPLVNIVIGIIFALDLAKVFGRSPLFGILGLYFFSLVGYIYLAFGDAHYVGPTNAPQQPLTNPMQPLAQPAAQTPTNPTTPTAM